MKQYETAEIEIIRFADEHDVITQSPLNGTGLPETGNP